MRVIDLLPGGTVDFSIDTVDYVVGLAPATTTTWFDVPAGTGSGLVEIVSGITFNRPIALDLVEGASYSLVVYGSDDPGLVLLEEPATPPGPGNAHVSLLHAAWSLGSGNPIDVWDTTDALAPALLATNVGYGDEVPVEAAAGRRRFTIDVDRDGVFETSDPMFIVELNDGDRYVVAFNSVVGSSASILHVVDPANATTEVVQVAPPFTMVHFVNVHPDYMTPPPQADFFVDLPTPRVSIPAKVGAGRIPIVSGVHDVDVAPEGQGRANAVASLADVPMPEDERREIIFWGSTAASTVAVIEAPDLSLASPGMAVGYAFHAASGVPAVDVYLDGTLLVDDLAEGVRSAPFDIGIGGTQVLGLDLDQDAVVDWNFPVPVLDDGGGYTFIGAIDDQGAPYLLMLRGHAHGAEVISPVR